MANLSKFQIIVLSIFGGGILLGLLALALFKNDSNVVQNISINVWGTWPQSDIDSLVSEINDATGVDMIVSYTEKNQATFERDLTESLALGEGPDAILIPQELLLTLENKLLVIPYDTIDARSYKDSFIEQAELYMTDIGVIGIPFSIDPLVMYWNRNIFTNAGIASYPKYWEDFTDLIKKINQKDDNSNIRKTAIAMGEFANISNARDIFSLVLLQSGNPITSNRESIIGGPGSDMTEQVINFYNNFSNPTSPNYSWNRALPLSKNFFLSGNLATYFGYASEFSDIRERNPNLNYDIAPMPQPKNTKVRVNYGRMYGFSIVRSAKDPAVTYSALLQFTTPLAQQKLSTLKYLPPIRRDMIAAGVTDPYLSIFYDIALTSKSFLDPNPSATALIFKNMNESVTSGRENISEAISRAHDEMDLLLQNR